MAFGGALVELVCGRVGARQPAGFSSGGLASVMGSAVIIASGSSEAATLLPCCFAALPPSSCSAVGARQLVVLNLSGPSEIRPARKCVRPTAKGPHTSSLSALCSGAGETAARPPALAPMTYDMAHTSVSAGGPYITGPSLRGTFSHCKSATFCHALPECVVRSASQVAPSAKLHFQPQSRPHFGPTSSSSSSPAPAPVPRGQSAGAA